MTRKLNQFGLDSDIDTLIEYFTASPPMGLLPVKPAEVLLSYTGPDRRKWPDQTNTTTTTIPVGGIAPATLATDRANFVVGRMKSKKCRIIYRRITTTAQ